MNNITISGLTKEQQVWADWMWMEQDYAQVVKACEQHRDARVVRDMIIAGELDNHMEVTDEVRQYLCSR